MNQHPLRRLLSYSRPYRGRFIVALLAMLVYAGAQAGVGYLVAPIINRVLPANDGTSFRFWAGAIIAAYLAKGLGSYFSTYLMTDSPSRRRSPTVSDTACCTCPTSLVMRDIS